MPFFPILIFFLLCGNIVWAQDSTQYIVANRENAKDQLDKPYVLMISADGFRHDLIEPFNAANLRRLGNSGVRAQSMQPAFPSLTFPNHYSLITGMYPAHHGLVSNTYYDRERKDIYSIGNKKVVRDGERYAGLPLWVLAEKNELLSASFYWVGSEADIADTRPSYYFNYAEVFDFDRRLEILKSWFLLPEEKRPHFISFYFPEVDHALHIYGEHSAEAKAAVDFVDKSVGKIDSLCKSLQLPINIIFVSDHGMAQTDTARTISMPRAIDTAKFVIPRGDAVVQLYAKNPKDILPTYKALKKEAGNKYDVYTRKNIPKRFHYRLKDDVHNRIGDIILISEPPLSFNFGHRKSIGRHGYDNRLPDMQAVFLAWGPAFKTNYTIGSFQNIHVYPLVAEILDLPYQHKIDGKLRVLKKVLKK